MQNFLRSRMDRVRILFWQYCSMKLPERQAVGWLGTRSLFSPLYFTDSALLAIPILDIETNRLDPIEILYSRHTLLCMTIYVHGMLT